MNIINTIEKIPDFFGSGHFDLDCWKEYMVACIPGACSKCLEDMRDELDSAYPILEEALSDVVKRTEAVRAFERVTNDLDARICEVFHRSLDVDIYLYLGLCNGAGWVTEIGGKTTVLIGIEKVMELSWCDEDAMNGLILHELGHVYQSEYGVLKRQTESSSDAFLWQLFTEGVAMVFEQEIVGDPEYFHQDKDNWKAWCDANRKHIVSSFGTDLGTMTKSTQRYFGDWVSFEGHADTGYYLGAGFVRFMMEEETFDTLIRYDIGKVREAFERFS